MATDTAVELEPLGDVAATAKRLYGIDIEALGTIQRRSWDKQERYLATFRMTGVVGEGAKAAGVTYEAPAYWSNHDLLRFKARYEVAKQAFATDVLERTMFDRIADPAGNRGSDILLIFALKAHKAEKYRDDNKPIDDSAKMVLNKLLAFEPKSNGNK